ncbi:hypothetical protein FBZ98_101990 [Rhizobium sp. ERR 922]|uniref:hypothetical protein n=1 Tax=unclassified Rhizobium TaxID=2613769 RepID=UPI0011A1A68A|nr:MULTISPECIES: hypothetical protein [unclassified Rhizobium]TWB61645.1 hypothetical protein FBZ98_101990 [Rhizobium sp. ERR 922]TWC04571.1 hypothetical protein FBZ97_101990 [Rhizobium sp. ERR 942]
MTPTAKSLSEQIKKAMEGVTQGEWSVDTDGSFGTKPRLYSEGDDGKLIAEFGNAEDPVTAQDEWEANGAYAALTQPANMLLILSALEDAERERNELRDKLAEAVKVIEFYANPDIYKPHPHGPAFDRRDVSFSARSFLSSVKGEGE